MAGVTEDLLTPLLRGDETGSLAPLNGGMSDGGGCEVTSPGPRVEYTKWETVKMMPPKPSQPRIRTTRVSRSVPTTLSQAQIKSSTLSARSSPILKLNTQSNKLEQKIFSPR